MMREGRKIMMMVVMTDRYTRTNVAVSRRIKG